MRATKNEKSLACEYNRPSSLADVLRLEKILS